MSMLVLGIMVVLAVFSRTLWNRLTPDDCITALRQEGADVQLGNAGEEYSVFLHVRDFDDNQLKRIMPYIRGLEPLACLVLSDTQISDASVDSLTHCKINALHITRTKVSARGAAELRRGLPHTWISHESLKGSE